MSVNKPILRIFSVLFVIVSMLAVTALQATHAAGVRYAKPGASGTGDCSSWANACTLQTALTNAASGDEIWVASGAYKPATGSDRNATFQLKDGVALYGGFAGTETARDQRNPGVNVTVLSGDIDNNDSQTPIITDLTTVTGNTNNSYRVVIGATGATLDGFTITAAYLDSTDGGGMYNSSGRSATLTNVTFSGNLAGNGGGMYNAGSATLTNVTFSGNRAGSWGGGLFNASGSSLILTNVTFSGNSAALSGGGMFNYPSSTTLTTVTFSGNSAGAYGGGLQNTSSSPVLTNVTFSGNSAENGGGTSNTFTANPTLSNVIFIGNTATQAGGGMYNDGNATVSNATFSGNSAVFGGGMFNNVVNINVGSPTLTNVTFTGNSANHGGGMVNNTNSHPTLTNITFSGNTATTEGGAMYNSSSRPTLTNVTFSGNSASYGGGMDNLSSNPTIRNAILWGNSAATAGAQIHNSSGSPVLSDSVVQGGCPAGITCTNIITTDPQLGTLGNYGGSTQTIPLLPGSSAIDTGNDATCAATDQRGVARPQGAHCDIGAYEWYELDTTAPMVNSITRLNPSPTNLANVGFSVQFSESVTGVVVSDFSLTTAGVSGASVTGVSGAGSLYTVTANTGTGTGTLRLDVVDDDSIVDMAGNPLGGTGTINGNFTGGETYDVRFHQIYLPLVLRNQP